MPRYDDRERGDRREERGGYRGERGEPYRGGGGGGRGGDSGPDAGATRLYVGRLSSRTRSRDLEDLFAKYGRWEKLSFCCRLLMSLYYCVQHLKQGLSYCPTEGNAFWAAHFCCTRDFTTFVLGLAEDETPCTLIDPACLHPTSQPHTWMTGSL